MARTVLVVEHSIAWRDRISRWLSNEGYEVLICPGPIAPDYRCLGGRGLSCPLALAADLVVLDMFLASDAMVAGTPGWRLLDYYTSRGSKVVAMTGWDEKLDIGGYEDVVSISRPPEKSEVIGAVKNLLDKKDSRLEPATSLANSRRSVRARLQLPGQADGY